MQESNNNVVTTTLVHDLLKEKRAERRWKNIRFVFWFLLFSGTIIGIFFATSNSSLQKRLGSDKYTALIRLNGMITADSDFSAESVIPNLREAFEDKKALGVVIDINSPGGTPVQATIIHDAIVSFKKKYHKKVIVVGEDLLTSGAYLVAVSGDKIYVNASTLTGSIGVIMKGFGFVDALKKIGVERRVYTAGDNKDRLDPFLPKNPGDAAKAQAVMTEVHQQFVRAVQAGRKGKLKSDDNTLFNGDFWTGQTALQLGLVDGLGNLMDVMEKEFQTTEFKDYSSASGFFRKVTGQLGSAFDSMFYVY